MSMRLTFVLATLALVAAACGSSTTTSEVSATDQRSAADEALSPATTDSSDLDAAVLARQEAAAAAEVNQPNLVISGTAIDTEVLVVADGSVTTLADAATGDRPLLIWFWAPH